VCFDQFDRAGSSLHAKKHVIRVEYKRDQRLQP
jgi:hypothetical protein